MTDLGELYAAARHRITDLLMSSPEGAAMAICPATPEWTVRDVVAHLRGITEDVRTGNLAGVATDPWTAAQVARHSDDSVEELLTGWAEDAQLLEGVLSSPQGESVGRAVIDIYTHEADIRGALSRPAPMTLDFADWAIPVAGGNVCAEIAASGLPPLRIVTSEGDDVGPADAPVVLTIQRFELFRAVLGRRSREQVLDYDWGGADGAPYLSHLFIFGPRDGALVE